MTSVTSAGPEQRVSVRNAGAAARLYLLLSAAFLLLGVVAAFVVSVKLAVPGFLAGAAEVSYGRLLPFGNLSLTQGWLAIGLLGASLYVVARVTGSDLWGGPLAAAALVVAGGSSLVGSVAVLAGYNQGRPYLEMPWWADLGFGIGLLLAAVVVTGTAAVRRVDTDSPVVWYAVAGSWLAALGFAFGAAPGLEGMNAALQSWFFRSSFLFGGLLVMAVGLAYYVVGSVTAWEAAPSRRPTPIGFWSLVFLAGWLAPRFGLHSPVPAWLQTVGVIFSLLLFIPVWTIAADLAGRLRGRWGAARVPISTWFLAAGGAFFVLLPVVNLAHALRSPAAVVRFSSWEPAFDLLFVFGVAGMWLLALVYHAAPVLFPGLASARGFGRWVWMFLAAGLLVALGGLWVAGLMQGYTWVGAVNSTAFANHGQGYLNSVQPLEAWYWVRAAGLALLAVGAALFAGSLFTAGRMDEDAAEPVAAPSLGEDEVAGDEAAEVSDARPVTIGGLMQAVVALFLLAALAVVIVPSFDEEMTEESLLALDRDFAAGSAEERGRQVYIREGCFYCHTQEVRAIITDVGLGPVSRPGDYALEGAPLGGTERVGPDLMHAGSRGATADPGWVAAHVARPRDASGPAAARPWSNMPAYDHLSAGDLEAVAAYIAALD